MMRLLRSTIPALLPALLLIGGAGCPATGTSETVCTVDGDCGDGKRCVNGECFQQTGDGGVTAACYNDTQCQAIDPALICNASGLCELPSTGNACTVTADCPLDQFCNTQAQVCIALQPGYCREASQCPSQKCSATTGGVGRCVECLAGSDCPSGQCLSNGVCATAAESCDPPCQTGYSCDRGQCVPVSGDCNPPCLTGEQCVQGVCYGENGCPRHAHPVDNQCACDEGYVPNSAGNACVPEGQACDPDAQLACQQQGGTWDAVNCVCLSGGTCDPPCAAGTACQNNVCVPVSGSCTTSLDCLMAGGSSFMTCDEASQTCVCDALMGFIMCIMLADDFDPTICDCIYYDEPDAGVPVDAGVPDSAQPDSATADAGVPDSAVADSGGGSDAGSVDSGGTTGSCDPACSGATPACVDGQCVACNQDSDCSSGLCERADHSCRNVECVYDEHCTSSYAPHCGYEYSCVSAHDCDAEMGYIPYPWDDSMTVTVEGDTYTAYSRYSPSGSCGAAEGPEDIYAFYLHREVRKLTVTMEALPSASSWDTHLYVASGICGSSNLGCYDAIPGQQPETLVLSSFNSSAMTIVADGYGSGDDGPYRLTVIVDECNGDGDCEASEHCLNASANNSRCKPD